MPETAGKPIRVCYLIDNLAVGGTEKQLLALIAHLDRSQVQPYLCLLDGTSDSSRALEPATCSVLRLGVKSLKSVRSLPAAWRFVRFLRQQRIDVVQLHFPDSTYFGAPLARLAGVRSVLRTRRNTGYWMTPRHRRAGRIISHLVDGTIANSEACRQAVIEQEGARPESVYVIPNGIDLERFRKYPPDRHADTALPMRVGMVANLRPIKNIEMFLRAAEALRPCDNLTFHIAGSGECLLSLRQLAIKMGISDRVDFVGSHQDVADFIHGLDIAVLTSRAEGFPSAILEYMAAAKPIVATAVSGVVELIDDGNTGLLVAENDWAGLASALRRLLVDPKMKNTLGRNGRERAADYQWPLITQQYLQLYEAQCASRALPAMVPQQVIRGNIGARLNRDNHAR